MYSRVRTALVIAILGGKVRHPHIEALTIAAHTLVHATHSTTTTYSLTPEYFALLIWIHSIGEPRFLPHQQEISVRF
jgi:hypothetical protein